MALRAVLFDAAGTLIRLRQPAGDTYARRVREFGVTLPPERLDEAFHRVLRAAPPMAFPDAPAAEIPALERAWWREVVRQTLRATDGTARLRDFEACFAALFADFASPAAWEAVPGAHAVLETLRRRGLRLAVVSNFDHRLPALLEALGLAAAFERVVLPGEARAAKPDPRIFALALAQLGVAAAEALYVGDDAAHDVAGARAAGLRALQVGPAATLAELPRMLEDAPPA